MAIPAIPDAGKPWLGWAQGVDAEARKVATKLDAAALDAAAAAVVTPGGSATAAAIAADPAVKAALGPGGSAGNLSTSTVQGISLVNALIYG